jgi:acetyl esterase/lipase
VLRALAYICFINALLLAVATVFIYAPAPLYFLWLVGVVSTELAPLIMIVALIPLAVACFAWRRRLHLKLACATAILSVFAAILAGLQTKSVLDFAQVHGETISLPDCLLFKGPDGKAAAKLETKEYAKRESGPLELDIYQPIGAPSQHPAVVVIHGGSWRRGRRSDFAQYDLWLAGLGYTVFDLDYRLADGKVHFPAPEDDIELALSWIELHAADYSVDHERIALMGRSAGAQLALVTAYKMALSGHSKAHCVISLYGPTDLPWDYANPIEPDIIHCQEVIANYLGGTPEALPALYAQASASALVGDRAPVTLFVYGGRDQIVSRLNADRLAQHLTEHKVPFQYLMMPWANHGFDWHFSGLSSQLSRHSIERFLRGNL